MSLVSTFSPHLPLLRRSARALTGSQQSGVAYIRASLEALGESPEAIASDHEPRTELYRFFHAIWGSTGAKLNIETSSETPADRRLQALAPVQRQAFLLPALAGFSSQDAAYILGVDDDEFGKLEARAHQDIEAEMSTKVLIVEDEPIIAADIESLVEDLGHEVIGIATTHAEAVTMANATTPGLILCDIQLADGSSGIDAAADILSKIDVPIIFITAFPERLLTGERVEPTFLIPKPFQENTVKAAIGQALFFNPANAPAAMS